MGAPADWTTGKKVVISPKLSDEEARRAFPQGFDTLKPYLRLVDLGKASS